MRVPPNSQPATPAATALLPISLAMLDAELLVHLFLQPHPQLLIDCAAQPCRRTLGVCDFLSQLLALRQHGAGVWLSNADVPLRRYLQQLGLGATFFLLD